MNNNDHTINFDYVSITFNIPSEIQKASIQKLIDLAQNKSSASELQIKCKYVRKRKNKNRYKKSFILEAKPITKYVLSAKSNVNGFEFRLELDPIDKHQEKIKKRNKQYFAKLSFNPNNTGIAGTQRISDFLSELIGRENTRAIYSTGRMTRVDMCVDLYQQLPRVFPYLPKVKHYEEKSSSGKVQSMIMGNGKSKDRVTIYDKAEQKKTKKISIQKIHFRLELRRRDLRCSPENFDPEPLREKLSEIEIFRISLLKDKNLLPSFKRSVKNKGVIGALRDQSKEDRRRQLKILRKHHSMRNPFDIEGINITSFHEILNVFINC